MNHLGYCFQHGRGVPMDPVRAVELYRQAAAVGNSGAQFNLAWCCSNGVGTPVNQ